MGVYMGIEWNDDADTDRHGKPTFAVGDKVRVVRDGGGGHLADIGSIDTIVAVSGALIKGKEWYYLPHEIQHAFAPGDRIRLTRTKGHYAAGDRGTVCITSDEAVGVRMDASVYGAHDWSFPYDACEPVRNEVPEKPADKEQVCIVARTKTNGQPMPSAAPLRHDNAASAIAEAERLARNNPGQRFDVYQRVTGRVAEQHIKMKEAA